MHTWCLKTFLMDWDKIFCICLHWIQWHSNRLCRLCSAQGPTASRGLSRLVGLQLLYYLPAPESRVQVVPCTRAHGIEGPYPPGWITVAVLSPCSRVQSAGCAVHKGPRHWGALSAWSDYSSVLSPCSRVYFEGQNRKITTGPKIGDPTPSPDPTLVGTCGASIRLDPPPQF